MNSTNRGLNRLLIVATGLLLLIVGAAAAIGAWLPGAKDTWTPISETVTTQVGSWLQQTPFPGADFSWLMIAVVAVLVVGIILLLAFSLRQGQGRTGTLIHDRSSDTGRTVVDVSVARDALADALGERDEFLSTSVSAYSVKRAPMLKVSATCRRGVSPRDATAIVEQNLEALDALLGQEVPVLLQLSGGFRAKVQQSTRLQ
ncbi:hypothetical protein C5E07_13340 [Pseudoclavibacter sp. RFBJ3]|uniref:hypothetical protein n=1 Tax=unclassified Pseudoclavibacter TaxID=2615177 RepID=UPI000CE8E395|nr:MULTISPECIES: hypothetical protein [unclassified Pseudoclavibacter]PPF82670.1 hypothetical protein C5C12_12415 [Pseudoclavibacter sp. RFBJ5]PPF91564.1 hypothetical protein C5E07_13340 [Pseudoclavibacter sp. RFBJ3]PPG22232.1 hypothetical protein C5E13_12665 [Pseudoclavibacter sp. RFBI4]